MNRAPTYRSTTAEIGLKAKNIPTNEMGRLTKPLVEIVAAYFEDPKVRAEYEVWKAARAAKSPSPARKEKLHAHETGPTHA